MANVGQGSTSFSFNFSFSVSCIVSFSFTFTLRFSYSSSLSFSLSCSSSGGSNGKSTIIICEGPLDARRHTRYTASRQRRASRTVRTHQRSRSIALRSRIHPRMNKAKHAGRLTRQRKPPPSEIDTRPSIEVGADLKCGRSSSL